MKNLLLIFSSLLLISISLPAFSQGTVRSLNDPPSNTGKGSSTNNGQGQQMTDKNCETYNYGEVTLINNSGKDIHLEIYLKKPGTSPVRIEKTKLGNGEKATRNLEEGYYRFTAFDQQFGGGEVAANNFPVNKCISKVVEITH